MPMYRFGWMVDGAEVNWWVIYLDDDEDAAREADQLEPYDGGGPLRLPAGGTATWQVADEHTMELVREKIAASEREQDILDRLDPDVEAPFVVLEDRAFVPEERPRGRCRPAGLGSEWFFVHARSPEEAVERACLYTLGTHPEQRHTEAYFAAYRQGLVPSMDEFEDVEPGESYKRLAEKEQVWQALTAWRRGIATGRVCEEEHARDISEALNAEAFTDCQRADMRALIREHFGDLPY